jgi:hypothetical protein
VCLKKTEQLVVDQRRFEFCQAPDSKLRVSISVANTETKRKGIYIPRNYRVPDQSVISLLYRDGTEEFAIGSEDLGIWESSDGRKLTSIPVRIEARRYADSVLALVAID